MGCPSTNKVFTLLHLCLRQAVRDRTLSLCIGNPNSDPCKVCAIINSTYSILSKISDTLIVWTPKYVIFSCFNHTGHGNSVGFPLSNSTGPIPDSVAVHKFTMTSIKSGSKRSHLTARSTCIPLQAHRDMVDHLYSVREMLVDR